MSFEGVDFYAMDDLLKVGQKAIQSIHIIAAEKFANRLQVNPAGKMLGIVVYD